MCKSHDVRRSTASGIHDLVVVRHAGRVGIFTDKTTDAVHAQSVRYQCRLAVLRPTDPRLERCT
jgi:hypothetical protein